MRITLTTRALAARAVLTASLLLQVGCIGTSPPSRFYLLSSTFSPESTDLTTNYETIVAMSTVKLPSHLDRPQIVTRSGPNSLALAEFDRWAEPLSENFTRVLLTNVSNLLEKDGVFVTSWRGGMKSDYRLFVEAKRFDIEGDRVVLDAFWGLLGGLEDAVVAKRRTVTTESIDGDADDYAAKAAALSRALGTLSQQITVGLKDFLKAQPTR